MFQSDDSYLMQTIFSYFDVCFYVPAHSDNSASVMSQYLNYGIIIHFLKKYSNVNFNAIVVIQVQHS